MSMSSEGSMGGQVVTRFADLPTGTEFYLRDFKLRKVSMGSAKVVETPLGKEKHKGAIKEIPDNFQL
jgi:hypothetical protein